MADPAYPDLKPVRIDGAPGGWEREVPGGGLPTVVNQSVPERLVFVGASNRSRQRRGLVSHKDIPIVLDGHALSGQGGGYDGC